LRIPRQHGKSRRLCRQKSNSGELDLRLRRRVPHDLEDFKNADVIEQLAEPVFQIASDLAQISAGRLSTD